MAIKNIRVTLANDTKAQGEADLIVDIPPSSRAISGVSGQIFVSKLTKQYPEISQYVVNASSNMVNAATEQAEQEGNRLKKVKLHYEQPGTIELEFFWEKP